MTVESDNGSTSGDLPVIPAAVDGDRPVWLYGVIGGSVALVVLLLLVLVVLTAYWFRSRNAATPTTTPHDTVFSGSGKLALCKNQIGCDNVEC